jgi:hypothetical protein
MASMDKVRAAILHELEHVGPCGFDQLVRSLPECSWNQIFAAVDCLSRNGAVALQKRNRFNYLVSRRPEPAARPQSTHRVIVVVGASQQP